MKSNRLIEQLKQHKMLMEQLKQQDILDEHKLISLKKIFDLVCQLDDKTLEKELKNDVYCSLVKYTASFIEFTFFTSMAFSLINGSWGSMLSGLLTILFIESIQEGLQGFLRKEGRFHLEFSANLPGNAVANSNDFLQSNVRFFYRKACAGNDLQQVETEPAILSQVLSY